MWFAGGRHKSGAGAGMTGAARAFLYWARANVYARMWTVRGVVREVLRNWVPLLVGGALAFLALMFAVRVGDDLWVHHRIKVTERADAEARLRLLCRDAKQVHETNYGERCREYLHASQTFPAWEALCAVANSYRLCDARTGCSAGAVLLLMCLPVTALVVYVLYRSNERYRLAARGYADRYDAEFMYGGAVCHAVPPRRLQAFCEDLHKAD